MAEVSRRIILKICGKEGSEHTRLEEDEEGR